MRKWPLILIAAVEALLVLVVVYCEPSYCVRGHLRGEAFFDDKPTSYWRQEIEQWDITFVQVPKIYQRDGTMDWALSLSPRSPRWFTRVRDWLIDRKPLDPFEFEERFYARAADPMLCELLGDPSPNVRLFARSILGLEPQLTKFHRH